MNKKIWILVAFILGLVILLSQEGTTNSTGAPTGHTGAPGELTCATSGCHDDDPVNSGGGGGVIVQIAGNPTNYTVNTTYTVTVTVGDFSKSRFGFEVTALDASDTKAGVLTVTDATNTRFITGGGRDYITHTATGTAAGQGNNQNWTFEWTAPSTLSGGDITFYVAGNAANNNNNNMGDLIYTTTFTLSAGGGTPAPVADFTISDNSVCVGENVTFTDASTGSVSNYGWSFGSGASLGSAFSVGPHTINYSTAGTKTVQLIVSGAGGADTISKTVTVSAGPTASAGNDVTICEGDNTPLSASGGVTYSWSPSAGLSSTSVANPIAGPTATTTYTVTATDANGCTDTDDVVVTVNPAPNITTSGDKTTCPGGVVTISAVGGSSYSWSPATGLNNPNISNPQASPTATTVYTVTVTGANGCTASEDVTVTVSPVTFPTSNDTTICRGTDVVISASGGVQYSWSPTASLNNASIASPTASPTTNTTYSVTVTDGSGCTGTGSVTVSLMGPTATAGGSAIICEGESTPLSATGGISYAWSPAGSLDNPTASNPNAMPISTTTYTVTVTDGMGCNDTDNVSVQVTPAPAAFTSGDTGICIGGSASISASGGAGYSWSPSASLDNAAIANPVASPTVTTTYTVTVTAANGCTTTRDLTVTVNALPTISTSANTTICAGGATQLNATGGVAYLWSPAGTLDAANIASPTASPTATTTYNVTVTDGNGCVGTGSTTVNVSNSLSVNVTSDTTICDGASVQLNASGGNTYSWSPATGLSSTGIFNPVASPTVTTTYTVDASDGVCQGSAQVTVTVQGSINAGITNDTTVCAGESALITASGGSTYSWSPSTGLSATNVPSVVATPPATTTYMVTITNGACAAVEEVTVTIDEPNIIKSGNDTICDGDSIQLVVSGGVGYSWSPIGTLSDANIPNPFASPLNTTTYSVTVINANSCVATETITISVEDPPLINTSNDVDICQGSSVTLSATGGIGYSWTPNAGLDNPSVANPVASPTVTTTYEVVGVSANGCSATDNVVVTVDDPINITVTPTDTTLVLTDNGYIPIPLNASGGINYDWSPGIGLEDSTIADPLLLGDPALNNLNTIVYSVVSTNGACADTATVTVTIDVQVGIEDMDISALTVYPNPVENILNVEFESNSLSDLMISITDLTGKQVMAFDPVQGAKAGIDVSDINSGMYLLVLENENTKLFKKIFIQ